MTPYDPIQTQNRVHRLLIQAIQPAIYTDHVPLSVEVFQCADPMPYAKAIEQTYKRVELGYTWGPVWSTAWFRLRGRVPKEFGSEWRLMFDTRTEALCWWNGAPYQGVELHRQDVKLPASAKAGSDLEVYIEAACNHMLGVGPDYGDSARMGELPRTQQGKLTQAHVARFHPDRWQLAVELDAVLNLAKDLPPGEARARQVITALADVVAIIRIDQLDETLPAARARLAKVLQMPNAGDATLAHCVGNAHIDLAWMWPIRETRRKASRTFSTVTRYMERHPDYRFLQSQAQLYEWVRQDYPALFDEIKKRVKTGQWEVGGAAWVEPDCNIPCGESLVRQLLVGTRYYAKHFGVTQNYFWQPDVFGYSAALPQILRLMGLDYFFSQKISWNQYNKFPHHTFKWVGIDGTGVISHFFPADTYIGNNQPNELRHGERNYQQSAKCPTWLQAFGWGDGGGGPTEDQVARVNILKDCAGVPKTRHGRVDQFTAEIAKHADKLPSWHGELYLELHRGTYTSQAFTKKGNRLGERLLQDVEVAQSLGAIGGKPRSDADATEVDRIWKLLLLNQFHDILPGSSITWVYDDARKDYADILGSAAKLLTTGGRVLNTSGRARTEVVTKPNGDLALAEAPAMSIGELKTVTPPPLKVADLTLENDYLRVTLDDVGRVTSLFDKTTGREAIRPGEFANQLMEFEDLPANWDAWDLDLAYRDKGVPITTKADHQIVERGPVRAAIEFTRKLGNASTLKQRVQLTANGRFVEFANHVDWNDSHKLLRVHHAVDVHTDHATYEIQFGHVRRTNHFNTSWDFARFEVPAQRWMDLSEPGFGVTLINDCKYGHSCLGNVMGLSLLRGTRSPDPKADIGTHEFRYALQPHGQFDAGVAVAAAESLNQPLRLVDRPAEASLVSLAGEGVVIDSVKPAEEGNDLILRLYECRGGRAKVSLTFHPAIKSVTPVNLMELPNGDKLAMKQQVVELALKPFQIQTLRLAQ